MSHTFNRKAFFGKVIQSLGKGIGSQIEKKLVEKLDAPLRPPGALDELEFLAACTRCGACTTACPYGAIQRLPISAGVAANTPSIDPNFQACKLCDDFPCIGSCSDGALLPLHGPPKMGRALVEKQACMTWADKICTLCYDACPLPETAIELDAEFHPQVLEGCVGCGLCQQSCPTKPKGIRALSWPRYHTKISADTTYFGFLPIDGD